jgi:hypothetical protein
MKTMCALILSRQPLRPCARTPWVQATLQALDWVEQQGHTLLATIGSPPWELMLSLACRRSLLLHILVPLESGSSLEQRTGWLKEQFALDTTHSTLEAIEATVDKTAFERRDELLVVQADCVLPLSLRKGGTFARLLDNVDSSRVDTRFCVPPASPAPSLGLVGDVDHLNPALEQLTGEYLIHWTRSATAPWPTERCCDYYCALAETSEYARSGFATLCNMLRCGRIVGSARHLPRGVRAVCFSNNSVARMVPLMRWRMRYRQLSFEPYGIGIHRAAAEALGVEPVCYYARGGGAMIAPSEAWRYQSLGKRGQWGVEGEYRLLGDVVLGSIEPGALVVLCATAREAELVEQCYSLRSVALWH